MRMLLLSAALLSVVSCKKKVEKEPPKLEFTEAKNETEEQNLKALCGAAKDVAAMEGVQDRMSRISEIAAPVSPTTVLIDGLLATEGPERLPLLKKLVAKYELEESCTDGLLMFEKSTPKPPDAGQGGTQDPPPEGAERPGADPPRGDGPPNGERDGPSRDDGPSGEAGGQAGDDRRGPGPDGNSGPGPDGNSGPGPDRNGPDGDNKK